MPLSETQRLRVTTRCRSSQPSLRNNSAGRRSNHRQRVLVQVRVDTEDVINLVCNHAFLILRDHS